MPQGVLISGVVAAIRPHPAAPLPPGAAGVLAALQLAAPAQAPDATEFVIRRDDGGIIAVALPSPAATPGASLAASKFAVGDRVELITGKHTELIHAAP